MGRDGVKVHGAYLRRAAQLKAREQRAPRAIPLKPKPPSRVPTVGRSRAQAAAAAAAAAPAQAASLTPTPEPPEVYDSFGQQEKREDGAGISGYTGHRSRYTNYTEGGRFIQGWKGGNGTVNDPDFQGTGISAEEMFKKKVEAKYGSPLVRGALDIATQPYGESAGSLEEALWSRG